MSEGRPWKKNIVGHADVDPRTLLPHPVNPKIHTAEQDAVVEASLRDLGWVKSVQVNVTTGRLLDGHERVELAVLRGEATVPVEYVEVDEAKEGTALMTLDASATLAQPHLERWATLRAQTQTHESALLGLWAGFAAAHRDALPPPGATQGGGGAAPETDPGVGDDRGARLQGEWETALGQLWAVGAHYVYCGDCTTPDAWSLLRERVGQVQGCITSPPYAEQRLQQYGGIPAARYVGWFTPIAQHLYAALADEGSFFLNLKEHSEGIRRPVYVHELVVELVRRGGWEYLDEFVWERPGVPGDPIERGKFKNMWEPVFWLAKQVRPVFHPERVQHRATHAIIDTNYQPGLDALQGTGRDMMGGDQRKGPGWAYPGNRLPSFGVAPALGHAGAFPVGLPQWFVEVYSEVGAWWVEPFLGSGSTLLACEATGRRCWGMDVDPRSVAITLARWQDETVGAAPASGVADKMWQEV